MDNVQRILVLDQIANESFCAYCSGYLGDSFKYQPDCCEHNHHSNLPRGRACQVCNQCERVARQKVYRRWRQKYNFLPENPDKATVKTFGKQRYHKFLQEIANYLIATYPRVRLAWGKKKKQLAKMLQGVASLDEYNRIPYPKHQVVPSEI